MHVHVTLHTDMFSHLFHILAIFAGCIAPLNVLIGGLVQVLLQVVERMLCYVCNAQVGVLDHCTAGGGDLSGQHLGFVRAGS